MMKTLFALLSLLAIVCIGQCQTLTNTVIDPDTSRSQCEPSIAAAKDTSGVIHIAAAFKNYPRSGGKIGRAYSADTGKTWNYVGDVPSFFSAGNDPSIAFDTKLGYAYATYVGDQGNAHYLERSTDWGVTWL